MDVGAVTKVSVDVLSPGIGVVVWLSQGGRVPPARRRIQCFALLPSNLQYRGISFPANKLQ
jgi:hypothetical protein